MADTRTCPRAWGVAATGFISVDELYAHCTREELAGRLDRNRNSNTFAHYLKGACHYGKMHGVRPARDGILPRGSQALQACTPIDTANLDSPFRYGRTGTPMGSLQVTRLGGIGGTAARSPAPLSLRVVAGNRRAFPNPDLSTTCRN